MALSATDLRDSYGKGPIASKAEYEAYQDAMKAAMVPPESNRGDWCILTAYLLEGLPAKVRKTIPGKVQTPQDHCEYDVGLAEALATLAQRNGELATLVEYKLGLKEAQNPATDGGQAKSPVKKPASGGKAPEAPVAMATAPKPAFPWRKIIMIGGLVVAVSGGIYVAWSLQAK